MSAPRASSLSNLEQIQTLTRTYMVIIKDYDHMTTMDELIKINISIVKKSLNLRTPFCTSTLTSKPR